MNWSFIYLLIIFFLFHLEVKGEVEVQGRKIENGDQENRVGDCLFK